MDLVGRIFRQSIFTAGSFFHEEQTIKAFKLPELPKRTKKPSVKNEEKTRDVSELRKAADRKKAEKADLQPRVTEPKREILARKEAKRPREPKKETPVKTDKTTSDTPMTRMSRHRRK